MENNTQNKQPEMVTAIQCLLDAHNAQRDLISAIERNIDILSPMPVKCPQAMEKQSENMCIMSVLKDITSGFCALNHRLIDLKNHISSIIPEQMG